MERCDPQRSHKERTGLHSALGWSYDNRELAALLGFINNAQDISFESAVCTISEPAFTIFSPLRSPDCLLLREDRGLQGKINSLGIIHQWPLASFSPDGKALLSPQGNSFHVQSPNIPNKTVITTWKKTDVMSQASKSDTSACLRDAESLSSLSFSWMHIYFVKTRKHPSSHS